MNRFYFLIPLSIFAVAQAFTQTAPISYSKPYEAGTIRPMSAQQAPHFEYAIPCEEGFRNRDMNEVIEKTSFLSCEPVWLIWSFANLPANVTVNFKVEITSTNGFRINYEGSYDGGPTGVGWWRAFYAFTSLNIGNYNWKMYEQTGGAYQLVSDKNFSVTDGPITIISTAQ